MSLFTLHAGDGYVYLTRQVANDDYVRSAGDPLVDYYQRIGNPPGQWVGSGCADLGLSGTVDEEQMLALFGEGLRPDANAFIAERIATGDSFDQALKAARLGRKFYAFDRGVPLLAAIREAYAGFAVAHRRRPSVEERRDIKESVARRHWTVERPSEPPPSDEQVRQYLVNELGKARQPVAGFDLTFSPVKSVSVLWALGGHEIRRIVEDVHEQAWRAALAYGEREASDTRVGANGIAFTPTSGFVATAFQHRDSRAGDPDLHTHMAVSNRVLAADGIWRTIDSRQLHKIAVSMSETYNTLIEHGLTERLGVRWADLERGAGKRSVREIDGLPSEWLTGFARRRTQVEVGYEQLVAEYVHRHGHTPPRSVQYQLAQQATLQNRPAKTDLHTLAEQIEDWNRHADELLPGADIPARIRGCLHRQEPPDTPEWDQLATSVVTRIAEQRATWAVYHVRAEAHRQLRPYAPSFGTQQALLHAIETVTRLALNHHSIVLDVEVDDLPRMLRRPDTANSASEEALRPHLTHTTADNPANNSGTRDANRDGQAGRDVGAEESVFRRRGSRIYTSEQILAAEQRLVDDARTTRGPVVPDTVREVALLRWQQDTGKTLNPGQRALVAHFVSSGRALAVGIGPPGTGKSTTMAAMRAAWETTGGRVVGFAPSAAAASVLGDELGVRADTLHSLIVARRNGVDVDVRPGDLLLVDEAGMAGTLVLDEVRQLAAERGAVVRLLGDYRQLTAVEAGGALRLIHHDAGGVELDEVRRFTRPDEAQTVLRFRVGDERAVDWYADNDRIIGAVGPAVLDQLYRDWRADVDAGRTAIMISDSTQVARELSARAQTERRAAGLVEPTGVRLHDGTVAGVGDRVVTRLNRRNLTLHGGRDYVKNGDLWEVVERHEDGRLTVQHIKHGGTVRLSARYVALHVELGYAATVHRSQGLTVEMCRAFLTAMAVREAALVALSRGRDGNYAYLDTEQVLHVDEPPTLPGDLYYRHREAQLAEDGLRAILAREGAELSATEQLRTALDAPHRLDVTVPEYTYARQLHHGQAALQEAETWVRAALPRYADDILADEAWHELARVLQEVRDTGADPIRTLRARAQERPLKDDPHDPAESVAQVLHWRITDNMPLRDTGPHPDRPDLLPGWVPTPPHPDDDNQIPGTLAEIVELGTWLRARTVQIAARVRQLGDRLAHRISTAAAAHHTTGDGRPSETGDTAYSDDQRAAPPPAWAVELGPVPDDPVVREQWIRRAGHVAAYRERWNIPDTNADLLPRGRGEQARARAWVAAYLRDHPLHRAAQDAAERDAQQRDQFAHHATRTADQQRRHGDDQRDAERCRDEMAALLREVWRHEPDLAELIVAIDAFDTVARRLSEAAEAGYDPREVLAELPLDALRAPHITNPAAYTAALVDVAVDRLRTGHADRDARRRAEQQRLDQMRDQVIDLLREAWHTRPHVAEKVIHAPAFGALAHVLDRYADAGLDARDLLAAIPLAKLETPTITHPDRFAIYLTHRIAQRQLDALDQARRAAHQHAEHLAVQQGAAATLRHAWTAHPEHAQHVIDGPAFRHLAQRMLAAQRDGHDVHAILRDLDPTALTAAHVPNPSGATTFAFSRALQRRIHQQQAQPPIPSTGTPRSIPEQDVQGVSPAATSPAPAAPPAPSLSGPASAEPGTAADHRPPGHSAEPAVARDQRGIVEVHWTQRSHDRLTDSQLRARLRNTQREVDRLARQHQLALENADQLRRAAEAGHGRHTRAVDINIGRLREQAAAVRDADELEHQWRDATERASDAAEQRTHAQHDLDRRGPLARGRRAELTQRITELAQVEEHAHQEAADLAQRAATLHQHTGSREQRQHIHTRAHQSEIDYPHARQAALDRDRAAAEHAEQRSIYLLDRHRQHVHELNHLRAEQHLRERLSDTARDLETIERTQLTPPQKDPTLDPQTLDPHLTGPQPPGTEPRIPASTRPEPAHPATTAEITSNRLAEPEPPPSGEPTAVDWDVDAAPPAPQPGEPEL